MRTALERLKTDPIFARLVHLFLHEFEDVGLYSGAGLTPTEIREASALAWQIYVERHPHPILLRYPDEPPR